MRRTIQSYVLVSAAQIPSFSGLIISEPLFSRWQRQLSWYSDSLSARRSGDRMPVKARFSAPVQTGPGAHSASCTMGTGSFPGGIERPGRDADPSPPSSAVVMKGQSYTSNPPMGRTDCIEPQCLYKGALYLYLSACTRVHFTFTSVPVQGCTLPLPQCLYKGALYLYLSACTRVHFTFTFTTIEHFSNAY